MGLYSGEEKQDGRLRAQAQLAQVHACAGLFFEEGKFLGGKIPFWSYKEEGRGRGGCERLG